MIRQPFVMGLTAGLLCLNQPSHATTEAPPALTQPNLDAKVDWPWPVADQEKFGLLLLELFEYGSNQGNGSVTWDALAWRGTDVNRLWLKTEGSYGLGSEKNGEGDFQLLYGRLITPYFDAQIGARYEQLLGEHTDASRWSLALGLQGLSLYVFELEAALFIGNEGHFSERLTASKDFLFSQKAVAQLRFESNAASKHSAEFESGHGLNDISIDLRLRYEIKRELAPYIGASWTKLLGETADYRTLSGDKESAWQTVAGVRAWY